MKDFIRLFKAIDSTTSTNSKIDALVDYFKEASDQDKLWTVAIFSHRRPPRSVNTTLLRKWAAELSNIPLWLFEESYHIVGDLAETIALVTPSNTSSFDWSLSRLIKELTAIKPLDEAQKKHFILTQWSIMDADERFIFNKLITGGFRVGVSQKTMVKAIAKYLEEDENVIAHRMMGDWSPFHNNWYELIVTETKGENQSRPYPFYLAYALDINFEDLGTPSQWSAEWKWDGIRGQLIKRDNQLFIWSRGEELVTDKYPELQKLLGIPSPDFVIDGEIIPMKNGQPLPFALLQQRIGRKTISKKHLAEIPIHLIAYDLLEFNGEDIRNKPLRNRRAILSQLIQELGPASQMVMSKEVEFEEWEDLAKKREKSRDHYAEGLMLKRYDSDYKVGRRRGDWWKWKVDPLEVDAVMIYAQRGHGRRANLYTDFTFAVWEGDRLVPFTKAYSGLTDNEFREVTTFVKSNTIERFGPVSSVNPTQVFTIGFEGIAASSRHKSGVALRFPRILRWRKDKVAIDADHLDTLKNML